MDNKVNETMQGLQAMIDQLKELEKENDHLKKQLAQEKRHSEQAVDHLYTLSVFINLWFQSFFGVWLQPHGCVACDLTKGGKDLDAYCDALERLCDFLEVSFWRVIALYVLHSSGRWTLANPKPAEFTPDLMEKEVQEIERIRQGRNLMPRDFLVRHCGTHEELLGYIFDSWLASRARATTDEEDLHRYLIRLRLEKHADLLHGRIPNQMLEPLRSSIRLTLLK